MKDEMLSEVSYHPKYALLWLVCVAGIAMAAIIAVYPWLSQFDQSFSRESLGFDRIPWVWLLVSFFAIWTADMRIVPAKYTMYRFQSSVRLLWKIVYSLSIPIATFLVCVYFGVDRHSYADICIVTFMTLTILIVAVLSCLAKPDSQLPKA